MKQKTFLATLAIAVFAVQLGHAAEQDWAFKGDWSESCCC